MRSSQLLFQLFWCASALLLLPWKAQACECEQDPTLQLAFQEADFVIQASLVKRLNTTSSSSSSSYEVDFSAKILRAWKGCSYFKGTNGSITVATGSEESLCGVTSLKAGFTYLVSGTFGSTKSKVYLTSCNFQSRWSALNATEVESLSQKYSNCTCTPQSCGPRPNKPNYRCPDWNTTAGPKCTYRQSLVKCAWETVQCPTCQKQSDCHSNQFCSAGRCRASGRCANDNDCLNPLNRYVGKPIGVPASCKKSECSVGTPGKCPDGSSPADCTVDPCTVTSCKQPHVSCAANYCGGGCNAIFYNASGYQVCTKA